ncbi:transcriptional regulator, RpiR family protein [Rosenbergiella nectarea]|uniref:transcriptional regulator, RpiR family protein n=1 Tax=Rosenbergiella nectarea TaxID=988801 RepID=UPI001BDB0436|nr:transcriptional regulator, RpiR family protein [Rosenbergiella nectarea]MBT0729751.1 transcriptional regulator, RpiR family protein [Rosenbergiella nectarea subsp. apis]
MKKNCDATIFHSSLYVRASEYLFHSSKATVFTRIAAGIIEKIGEFPHVNIEALALYCLTTPSSVTKFCKIIGYDSFAELRNNATYPSNYQLNAAMRDEREIINDIYKFLPLEKCEDMARSMANKKKILIITNDFTFNISNIFREVLSSFTRTVYLANRQNNELIHCLFGVVDSVVVLTFTGDWMQKERWCSVIPDNLSFFLISTKIPAVLSGRPEVWVPINGYPDLMASNYHSHKFMESVIYIIAKKIIEIT